jgi:hypothetical protein
MTKPSLSVLAPKRPEPVAAPAPQEPAATAAPEPAKKVKPSRVARRAFGTFLREEDYQTLRRISFEQSRPIQAIVDEALADVFAKHNYSEYARRGG